MANKNNDEKRENNVGYESARFATQEDENVVFDEDGGVYIAESDSFSERFQKYIFDCQTMLSSSLSHMRQPSTIIVIILLIIAYILLGVAGAVEFEFFSDNMVQYVTTNLDIIVNALLGYFYGPVTCAIAVTLCCVVRIITNRSIFFIGYLLGAAVAGFLHGWILYRLKNLWFGSRFRGFFTDLLYKVVLVRLVVSVFVNILIMSVVYKIFIHFPFREFFINYSKSGVPISTPIQFFKVFFVSVGFETIIVFAAIVIVNFIAMKAFPAHFAREEIIVNQDGTIINPDENINS